MEEWQEEIPEVTIKDLQNYCTKLAELRKVKDEESSKLKLLDEEMDVLEGKILTILKEAGIPNFKGEFGSVSIKNNRSITQPSSMDEKLKFFDYLRQQGIFEEMVSVNSRTLNSWANKEIEIREKDGVFGWVPPGLSAPNEYQTLVLRKK